MEKINPIQKTIETSKVEKIMDGDVYNISYSNNEVLENIIKKIATAFGEPNFLQKEIIKTIKDERDWRFEGTYNLKLRNGKLVFDNRNGRGVAENRQKMKEIIDNI